MQVEAGMGGVTRPARSVGGSADSPVAIGAQKPPHMVARRDEGPCAR